MKNSGIVITKDLLPAKRCDEIINVFEHAHKTSPSWIKFSKVGQQPGVPRTDASLCLDEIMGEKQFESGLPKIVNDHITKAAQDYIALYPVLISKGTSLYSVRQKLQKTPISGGFHTWHCENYDMAHIHRILAWTIYLNDVEEGGETEFLYQSERVKPVKGRTLIFPAGFMHTHRGNPPISNEKYILTGWFNLRLAEKGPITSI